jgi:hypothetical protein
MDVIVVLPAPEGLAAGGGRHLGSAGRHDALQDREEEIRIRAFDAPRAYARDVARRGTGSVSARRRATKLDRVAPVAVSTPLAAFMRHVIRRVGI